MISYKDMTFCGYTKCSDKKCERRITPKVRRQAKKSGLPICQYAEQPDCYEEK